jgi:hypothetical protein
VTRERIDSGRVRNLFDKEKREAPHGKAEAKEETMKNTKMYDPSKMFMLPQEAKGERSTVQLSCGLGKNVIGLALLNLEHAELGDDRVVLGNDDFTITVTAQKSGAIGKVFYDLFENADE